MHAAASIGILAPGMTGKTTAPGSTKRGPTHPVSARPTIHAPWRRSLGVQERLS
jgi:hypothetical protein